MSALNNGQYSVSSRHMLDVKIFTTSRQVRCVYCTTLLYNLLPWSPNPHIVEIVLDSDGKNTCHPVCQYRSGHYTGRGVLSNMYAVLGCSGRQPLNISKGVIKIIFWAAIANIKSTWQTPDTIKPPTAVIRFTEHLADVIWPTTDITRQNEPITMAILRLTKYSVDVIYPATGITRLNIWHTSSHLLYNMGGEDSLVVERRTRDRKVAGSSPGRSGGRNFFSLVILLRWRLFRYPFHPRVTAVARNRSPWFCQKCKWQVTAKHTRTLGMWPRNLVLDCIVYTEREPEWQQFHVAPAMWQPHSAVSTPLPWIFKKHIV